MPYQSNADLPRDVKEHLPEHAQDIYRAAFNSAFEQYHHQEGSAHAVAWNAVEQKYQKANNGQWQEK